MWTAVSIVVPLAVLAWLMRSARHTPLLLCAFPVLLTLGPAAYIDSVWLTAELPFLPDALIWRDWTMLSLLVAWAYAVVAFRHRSPGRLVVGIDTWIVIALVAVLALEAPIAWIDDGHLGLGVPYAMRNWTYLPLSLVLWAGILRRCGVEEVLDFIDKLAWLMVPLSAMYCLSEVGLLVNPYVGWEPFESGGVLLVRDTLTLPFFLPLAVAWFVARRSQTPMTVAGTAVLLAGCVLSYSRTAIIGIVACVACTAIARLIAAGRFAQLMRTVILLTLVAGLGVTALLLFAPGQAGYAVGRFEPLVADRSAESNTARRLAWFEDGAAVAEETDPLLGPGYSVEGTRARLAYADNPSVFLWDLTWAAVLFSLGWIGFAILAAMYGQYLVFAVTAAVRPPHGAGSELLAALAGLAAYDIVRTFSTFAWGIYPVASMLPLALLYVARRGAWWHVACAAHPGLLESGRDEPIRQGGGLHPSRVSESRR